MVNKHTKKVIPEYDVKRDDIDKILKSFNTISAFRNADISIDVDPYN